MRVLPGITCVAAVLVAAPLHAAAPSFDCGKAEGEVAATICADPQLAAIDREAARLLVLAGESADTTREQRARLMASQRDWLRRRDDCAQADDLRACVLAQYLIRIHQLRQDYAAARSDDDDGISLGPFTVRCDDGENGIGLTFVNADPSVALLRWPDRTLVLTQTRSGSGARYASESAAGETVFWIKGNEAMFERPGKQPLSCTISEGDASTP